MSGAGSSTACLAVVDGVSGRLTVANLGDSGFAVVRGGQSVLQSAEQQHAFNFPFQICKLGLEDSGNGDRLMNLIYSFCAPYCTHAPLRSDASAASCPHSELRTPMAMKSH